MSLNAFQRRHPWIMTPLQWLSIVMTPEHWPFLSPALAGAITRRLVVDTTRLARTIRRINPLTAMREAALPGSRLLQSVDWQLRKLFWTALWCGISYPPDAAALGVRRHRLHVSVPDHPWLLQRWRGGVRHQPSRRRR